MQFLSLKLWLPLLCPPPPLTCNKYSHSKIWTRLSKHNLENHWLSGLDQQFTKNKLQKTTTTKTRSQFKWTKKADTETVNNLIFTLNGVIKVSIGCSCFFFFSKTLSDYVIWLCFKLPADVFRWMSWYNWMLILIQWWYVWASFLVRCQNLLLYSA